MSKYVIMLLLSATISASVFAVELTNNGKPTADIVLSPEATASVRTAARELKRHLKKISGAKLEIVNTPSKQMKNHIYIGESNFTRELGVNLDDIKDDGFKIIADKNYLVLAGNDIDNGSVYMKWPRKMPGGRQKAWEQFCKQRWRFPPIYDSNEFNKECGFHLKDGTGTLYAVYHFLESLGMRWYMPIPEIGIVYPSEKSITVKPLSLKKEPEFAQRILTDVSGGNFTNEFLWYKSMKVGTAFNMPIYHSLSGPLLKRRMPQHKQPKEYYGKINGKRNYHAPKLTNKRLRNDFIAYLEAVDRAFPGIPYTCIGQPDGWSLMDDEDRQAGWDRQKERGPIGRFSDYYWDFVMDVYKQYKAKHPEKKYTVFAYGPTAHPPVKPKKMPKDVAVVFCQASSIWMLPSSRESLKARQEWLQKLSDSGCDKNQFMIWEYYIRHAARYGFPPVPIIFNQLMQQSFKGLYGRCAGFTVEVGWTAGKERARTRLGLRRPGLMHLTLYLHNRLCWDRNLDMQAVLDEYYDLFFGPARKEMKEFYEFAEKVWMRPEQRKITVAGGFLNKADVDTFFNILKRAKDKTGDTVYGKRIDFIASEMEPLKKVHDNLKRTGPKIRCFSVAYNVNIDGKPIWHRAGGFYQLRDMITGENPSHVETNVSFRWQQPYIIVEVDCIEPKMNKLMAGCKDRDSHDIYGDDNIEILLETPKGTFVKIVVNPNGSINDTSQGGNVADLPSFYTVDDVKVKKLPDRWTVTAKIDVRKLGADRPSPFYPWGVNICRQRMTENKPEYYMLSPSGTSFKDMKCFGNLYMRK